MCNSYERLESPMQILTACIGKKITVFLKWGWRTGYAGVLEDVDGYFNLVLTNAEEYDQDKLIGTLERIAIRNNNVRTINLPPESNIKPEF